ncbi:Cupin domain protein [Pseudoxanthomonas sp. GM95]|uniref:cupin domain-containing protein n=1 Tax=Pseudoxanthomonas sp. GM95 TaxID=1881043 RepID=UPI0008B43C76|nr:cupin domain-containing protein [Pseudoxanthomonas sp. GM95]SEM54898.1 Cupin domain protein [Pseudoxanthomonas sp. GM95]
MSKDDHEHAPPTRDEIVSQGTCAWNGKPYDAYPPGTPELTVKRMTIPPRTKLAWHTHPMPNASYILSGQLTVEDRATGQTHVVRAGQSFNEQVGAEHRGFTGDEPCVVVITYAGTPGMPLSVPAPDRGDANP